MYTSMRRSILAGVMGGLLTITLTSATARADTAFTVNPKAVNVLYPSAFTAGLIDFSYKAEVDAARTTPTGGTFSETGVVSFSAYRLLDQSVICAGNTAIGPCAPPAPASGLNFNYLMWAHFSAAGTTSLIPPSGPPFTGIHFDVSAFTIDKIVIDPSGNDCIHSSAAATCPAPATPITIGAGGGNESVVLVDPTGDDKLVAHSIGFIVGDGNANFAGTAQGDFHAFVFAVPDSVAPVPGTGGLYFGWPPAGFALPAIVNVSGNNDNIHLPPTLDPLTFTDAFIQGAGQAHFDFAPIPEPTTLLLLGSGLFGLVIWQRSRSKKG